MYKQFIVVFISLFFISDMVLFAVDRAFNKTVDTVYSSIYNDSRIFISDIQSNNQALTEYATNKLVSMIVNDRRNRNLVILDRDTKNIELMNREMNYQLSGEVSDETILSLGKKLGAEVIVTGNIKQHIGNFLLHIRIIHIETGRILGVVNETIRNDKEFLSFLSNTKQTISWQNKEWMNNWLYMGLRLGFSPNIYNLNSNMDMEAEMYISPVFAFQIGLHITKNFFLQTELFYTNDEIIIKKPENISLKSSSLTIPIIAKLGFSYDIFHYGFLGGIAFPINLENLEVVKNNIKQDYEFSLPISLMVGINLGIKFGPGVVFTDIRLLQDLGFINANSSDQYSRTKINISLGYDFALWGKQ